MRIPDNRMVVFLLAASLPLAGCGGGTEEADPTPPAAAVSPPPDSTPPDSLLYGAPAREIVRTIPIDAEMPNLPAGWEGMQIAVLSDLQLGLWSDNAVVAERAIRTAAESTADVIFLLGDFVARPVALGELSRVLAPLRGRPALAVLGDRDSATDSLEARVWSTLDEIGVVVLDNSAAPLARGGDTAFVAGIGPDFGALPEGRQAEVIAALAGTPRTPILLTHRPGIAPVLPDARYSLVLAGHTFCGDVEISGTPTLSQLRTETLAGTGVDDVDRLFRIGGNNLLVTCGIGYSFVPVRRGAPPEVLLLTLRGVGDSEDPGE